MHVCNKKKTVNTISEDLELNESDESDESNE